MQQALNYINTAVSHAHSWKLIKPHMLQIIQDIVFPLMSYSEADAELWDTDPYDYIRIKFDIFEDFVSPVTAAQTLLRHIRSGDQLCFYQVEVFLSPTAPYDTVVSSLKSL